jgi:hypothetical protein
MAEILFTVVFTASVLGVCMSVKYLCRKAMSAKDKK